MIYYQDPLRESERIEDVYLYSIDCNGGGIRKHHGNVVKEVFRHNGYVPYTTVSFMVTNNEGLEFKRRTCAENPGEVYSKAVWLEEEDDSKAVRILIEYEKREIEKLKDKIENHKICIKSLENYKKGEN